MNILLSFRVVSDINYPKTIDDVAYPQSIDWRPLNQFQVLAKVLESYSVLKFEKAFIFVDIEDNTSVEVEAISALIQKNVTASSLVVSYDRPRKKDDWLEVLTAIADREAPYLISMNHDLEFIGTADQFELLIKRYRNELLHKGAMLAYAHVPEYLAIAKMNIFGYDFHKKGLCYIDNGPRKWVDCVFIMTIETLCSIFEGIKGNGPDYLPRIDWATAEFGFLDVQTMVHPIELFRHYDGSTHVVCSRLLDRFDSTTRYIQTDCGAKLFIRFVELYHIYWAKRLATLRFDILGRRNFRQIYAESVSEFLASAKDVSSLDLPKEDLDTFYRRVAYYQDICFQDSFLDSKTIDQSKLPKSFAKIRKVVRKLFR